MPRTLNLLLVLLLSSCASSTLTAPTIPSIPTQMATVTSTQTATEKPSPTIAVSATATATAPACDPLINACRVTRTFPLIRPFTAEYNLLFDRTYLFGTTKQNTARPHHGVEFNNGFGVPVLAAADGEVVVAGDDKLELYGPYTNFYGKLIVIKHDGANSSDPIFTLYGHLSEVNVGVGADVKSGDVIGAVGRSGIATGPHLHFEVRAASNTYGDSVNPLLWFAPLEGTGMIVVRVTDAQGNFLTRAKVVIQYLGASGDAEAMSEYPVYVYESMSVKSDSVLHENFVISDLPAGKYRIIVKHVNFVFGERIVEITPNEVLLAAFEFK